MSKPPPPPTNLVVFEDNILWNQVETYDNDKWSRAIGYVVFIRFDDRRYEEQRIIIDG